MLSILSRPQCVKAWIISLWALYGLRYCKQPWTAQLGTARGQYGLIRLCTKPMQDFCKFWLCQFLDVSTSMSYGTLAGPTQAPYGSHRIWKTLDIPMRGLYDARQASHRDHVESCDLFYQTTSVQPGQTVRVHSLMWPREQHWHKIPTGPSLGFTGKKSYGCWQSYLARGWMWLRHKQ